MLRETLQVYEHITTHTHTTYQHYNWDIITMGTPTAFSRLCGAIENEDTTQLSELLNEDHDFDISTGENQLFWHAISLGRNKSLKVLLEHPDANPSMNSNRLLQCAIDCNNHEAVKQILDHKDTHIPPDDSRTLLNGANRCDVDIVQSLWKDRRFQSAVQENACVQLISASSELI